MKNIAKQLYWLLAEGRALKDARSVFFTCEEERLRARNAFRGHTYSETVTLFGTADPGTNLERDCSLLKETFPFLRDRKFLLFLGRIHPKKGCDLLIEGFAKCLNGLPDNLDIVMAGPDQVGWSTTLRAKARKLGVAHRIHWSGMLAGPCKWGALASAEALVLPSHQENFGFVVAEALACSTPVLISDKVNIWREIVHANAGFAESDSVDGTESLLNRFYSLTQVERSELGRNGRALFLSSFDIEVTARHFARDVASLLGATQYSRKVL